MKTKTCCICKEDLPTDKFKSNKAKKDGLQAQCAECQAEYRRKHYLKNQDKYRNMIAERKQKYKKEYYEWMNEQSCKECGNDDMRVLELHHTGDKSYTIAKKVGSRPLSSLKDEIDKCEVLCANCHRIKTAIEQKWYAGLM